MSQSFPVDGDLDRIVAELRADVVAHPLQGLQIVLLGDGHLVARLPLVAADVEDPLGDDAELGQKAPREPDQEPRIDPHRAVVGAAAAGAAGAEDDVLEAVEVLVVAGRPGLDPPGGDPAGPVEVALEDLADLVGLPDGRHGRIVRAGQEIVTGLGAEAAVDAGGQRDRQRTGNAAAEQIEEPARVVAGFVGPEPAILDRGQSLALSPGLCAGIKGSFDDSRGSRLPALHARSFPWAAPDRPDRAGGKAPLWPSERPR